MTAQAFYVYFVFHFNHFKINCFIEYIVSKDNSMMKIVIKMCLLLYIYNVHVYIHNHVC